MNIRKLLRMGAKGAKGAREIFLRNKFCANSARAVRRAGQLLAITAFMRVRKDNCRNYIEPVSVIGAG